MEIKNVRPYMDMYHTENESYGVKWETSKPFIYSFSQSAPYKDLTNRRVVLSNDLPKDRSAIAIAHNPEHPCGIMTLSNLAASKRANFTNVRRDMFSDHQGLWNNSLFNTRGATIDRGVSTFSNLQGAWGRIGPSTFDAIHVTEEWPDCWGVRCFEPSTLRSLRDHRHVDPRDSWVPIEVIPQNMQRSMPYRRMVDLDDN